MTHRGRVLVGVDGSAGAAAALRWAAEEARLRGATLEVVHAWMLPFGSGHAGVATAGRATFERAGAHLLDSVVDLVLGDAPGLDVRRTLVGGDPAEALVDLSGDADLLVVGSRGHGGFAGLLLGSVSRRCLHQARCPVTVVRTVPGAGDGEAEGDARAAGVSR